MNAADSGFFAVNLQPAVEVGPMATSVQEDDPANQVSANVPEPQQGVTATRETVIPPNERYWTPCW